jgi:hypothetical protein
VITSIFRDYYNHNNIEGVLQNDHTEIMYRMHIYEVPTNTRIPDMTQIKLTSMYQ